MKKLMVFGLLAAIGAVAFIGRADAAGMHDFCRVNPTAPQCQHPHPPGPHFGHGYNRWRGQDGVFFGFGQPFPPRYVPNQGLCQDIANSLSDQGYRNVRALRCAGRYYIFGVWRNGQRLNLYITPYDGRIRKITPAY